MTGTRRLRRWPWAVAGVSGALFALATVFSVASSTDVVDQVLTLVLYPPAVTSLLGVGALVVARVPGNRVGTLLLAAGVIMSTAVTGGAYAQLGWSQPAGPWPGTVVGALLNQVLFVYPLVLTLVVTPLYFPNGRLPGPRWRAMVWLAAAALAATTVSDLSRQATLVADIPNPFANALPEPVVDVLAAFSSLSSVVGFGGAAAAVYVRWRRSRGIERQQLKWLLAVAAVAAVMVPASFLAPADGGLADVLFVFDLLLFAAFPVAIGLAVLRYRLYELDRIVGRTVAYAIITATLAAAFILVNVALQALLADLTGSSTLVTAIATLVVAGLFQPVRRGVQQPVDRRFSRARVSGERVVEAFSRQARDEVDIELLRRAVVGTAHDAVAPAGAALWLRAGRTG